LTEYAKTYWDPPWEGEVKILGVQLGPKAWDWKREETFSFAYHESRHCDHMQDIRDKECSMWHKLVEQVGPFWIAATEMEAWGFQMLSAYCSYRCVDHAVIQHFAENYGYTNIMAHSEQSPLTEEVRAWLKQRVEDWYGFAMGGAFPKMLWGEGDWQHMPQIHRYHIPPPLWNTYDPCD